MFCFCFFISLFFNNSIPARPIISKSTKRHFSKLSVLVELWLWIIILKLVSGSLKGRCHGNQCLLALSTELSSGDKSVYYYYFFDPGTQFPIIIIVIIIIINFIPQVVKIPGG